MSDIYDDENPNVRQSNMIGDPGPGVFAPDAHRLAGLVATHHHDADYGLPDTTVTIAEGVPGTTLSCSHGGVSYVAGETAVVPAAVARFWVRSGWATAEPDEQPGEPELCRGPQQAVPTRARSAKQPAAAGNGRRSPKR